MKHLLFYTTPLLEKELLLLYQSFPDDLREKGMQLFLSNLELQIIRCIINALNEKNRSIFFTTYLENPSDPKLLTLLETIDADLAETIPELFERTLLRLKQNTLNPKNNTEGQHL